MRKRQRTWDDLVWVMQVEYGWGLSLRRIKDDADYHMSGSYGLHTINERVQQAGALAGGQLAAAIANLHRSKLCYSFVSL